MFSKFFILNICISYAMQFQILPQTEDICKKRCKKTMQKRRCCNDLIWIGFPFFKVDIAKFNKSKLNQNKVLKSWKFYIFFFFINDPLRLAVLRCIPCFCLSTRVWVVQPSLYQLVSRLILLQVFHSQG